MKLNIKEFFVNKLNRVYAFIFVFLLVQWPYHSISQTNRTGNLSAVVDSIITVMPGAGTNVYQAPTSQQLGDFGNAVQFILNGNYVTAATLCMGFDYQLIHFTDNSGGPATDFYVMMKTIGSLNYWGTYIFNVNPTLPNLILQAPHPKFDSNTGNESFYVFKNSGAKAFCLAGTHRCNQSVFSTCSGTTTACGVNEPFRISDMAHNVNSAFYRTTMTLFYNLPNSIFIQLHGFSKQPTDPYVILSNGTHYTPTTDYVIQLKNQMQVIDNSLTFKIAHIDTAWTKLNALTNSEGRLINQSSNICNSNATHSTGRFIHIEQEYSKLRQNQSGWNKILQAILNVFPSAPLPLQLIDFNAHCDKEKVNITCTIFIHDVSTITFQKSFEGKTFIDLETFSTSNLNNMTHTFLTYDIVADGYNMFYRIKQKDLNGTNLFGNVISKTCYNNQFVCFYDAALHQIKIQFSHLMPDCRIEIYSDNGVKVFEDELLMQAATVVNATDLPRGIYFVRMISKDFSEGKKIQIIK